MTKHNREWTMKQRLDLESAKHEVSEVLDKLISAAEVTVLGIRSGRVRVKAHWDSFGGHCLTIKVDFPCWPTYAALERSKLATSKLERSKDD